MAGELYPVAGCRFYIGGPISVGKIDLVAADFSTQSWTEVDGYSDMGAIGDNSALITTPLINRGRDYKQKGTANAPTRSDKFAVVAGDPGQALLIAAALPSNRNNTAIRIVLNDAAAVRVNPVTISIASPGVFTWTGHGLSVGDGISFATTGALPTGIVAATTYYVKTTPDANTFTIAATSGGTAIVTTGTQSGVHTASTVPFPAERLMAGLVMSALEEGGGANTMRMLSSSIEVNSNTVKIVRIGS
ncbi:MAG: hypothetical protein ABI216_15705 [Devosia sp.]